MINTGLSQQGRTTQNYLNVSVGGVRDPEEFMQKKTAGSFFVLTNFSQLKIKITPLRENTKHLRIEKESHVNININSFSFTIYLNICTS